MKRFQIAAHLAEAERHAATGERIVSQQRARVAELERDGHDARCARDLLRIFEEIQELHVADRDRLRKELDDAGDW